MIITTLFTSTDAARAERLFDAINWLGGAGHCLLAHPADVHPEMREKVKISAEVACKSVDMIQVELINGQTKIQQINSAFRQIARHTHQCYTQPWLWLEPCCVPLKHNWIGSILAEYKSQPRRYMGAYMQGKTQRFLSRVAVYPSNAIGDVDGACQTPNPFHRVVEIMPRSANSKLFRIGEWKAEMVLGEAVLIDGDKSGVLIESVIDNVKPVAKPAGKGKVAA